MATRRRIRLIGRNPAGPPETTPKDRRSPNGPFMEWFPNRPLKLCAGYPSQVTEEGRVLHAPLATSVTYPNQQRRGLFVFRRLHLGGSAESRSLVWAVSVRRHCVGVACYELGLLLGARPCRGVAVGISHAEGCVGFGSAVSALELQATHAVASIVDL